MADRYLIVDDTTGKYKRGATVGGGGGSYVDEDFDVGVGGVSFVNLVADISPTSVIDVFINGVLKRECGSYDWTRDNALNKITFTFTVPEFAWIRVRVTG